MKCFYYTIEVWLGVSLLGINKHLLGWNWVVPNAVFLVIGLGGGRSDTLVLVGIGWYWLVDQRLICLRGCRSVKRWCSWG